MLPRLIRLPPSLFVIVYLFFFICIMTIPSQILFYSFRERWNRSGIYERIHARLGNKQNSGNKTSDALKSKKIGFNNRYSNVYPLNFNNITTKYKKHKSRFNLPRCVSLLRHGEEKFQCNNSCCISNTAYNKPKETQLLFEQVNLFCWRLFH